MSALRQLHVVGTHYEIGFEVGTLQRAHIQRALREYEYIRERVEPFVTSSGKGVYEKFVETISEFYPQYMEELNGIADGAQVPLMQIMLINLEPEISAILGDGPPTVAESTQDGRVFGTSGCTDIYIDRQDEDGFKGIVHSEDVAPVFVNTGLLINATINSTRYPAEKFTAFTVAGFLPGGMYGFNANGLIHTGNAIFPKDIQRAGIPRRIITRALLAAKTIDEAVEFVKRAPGLASGYSLNLLRGFEHQHQFKILEMHGKENGTETSLQSPTKCYHHCNRLKHLQKSEFPDDSSVHRTKKIESVENTLNTKSDVLKIMSDVSDPQFPVYRDGDGIDSLATSSIVLFDMECMKMEIYIGKPHGASPLITTEVPRAV
ncbi:hypothetical protein ScPMuIL_017388 [Solemya velum]